ncbi:putative ribonuclease H protein [Nymphaea thermarum]|nr:putative ribonuclease H protein [Nymphaea thermarum]
MRILAWNARGLAGATAQHDLQLMFQFAHPDIAVLTDTKLNETALTKLSLKFSRYLSISNLHLNGQWARIWLLWDADKMQVQTVKVQAHWIAIEVKHLNTGRIFSVLGVYLNPDFRIRRFQYDELNEELASLCKPNVCLGDFNSVRDMAQKTGRPPTLWPCILFNNFIASNQFVEIQDPDIKYSWSNNREGPANVQSLIDHCFVSHDWLECREWNFSLRILPRTSFDHSPIVLAAERNHVFTCGKSVFHYFNYWEQFPQCANHIADCWSHHVTGCPMVRLVSKLHLVSDKLREWSKQGPNDLVRIIERLRVQVGVAQNHLDRVDLSDSSRSGILPSSVCTGLSVIDAENDLLVSPIRDEEIHWAVLRAKKDSTAGPDGFNNRFYQSYWSIIGPDVSLAIKEFLRSGRIAESRSCFPMRRLCLVKHVLASIPSYWMMVLWIPLPTCHLIEKLCSGFIWGDDLEAKGAHLISWSALCKPKVEGGVGLRRMVDINRANFCFLGIKAITQDSLWAELVRAKYLTNKSIWKYRTRRSDSSLWKRVIKCWQLIEAQVHWRVNNGSRVKFWRDRWNGVIISNMISPTSWPLIQDTINCTIKELLTDQQTYVHMFLDSMSIPMHLLRLEESRHDLLEWVDRGSRPLSRHHLWDFLRKSSPSQPWRNAIWNVGAPPRAAWTTYLAVEGRLQVDARAQKHGLYLASHCYICKSAQEDINHVFLHCKEAKSLWELVIKKFKQRNFHPLTVKDALAWWTSRKFRNKVLFKCWKNLLHIILWHIWKWRNNCKHGDKTTITYSGKALWSYCRDFMITKDWKQVDRQAILTWLQVGLLWGG